MLGTYSRLLVAAVLLGLSVACDDDDDDRIDEAGRGGDVAATPATQVAGYRDEEQDPRIEEVIVGDDGLQPRQLTIQLGVPTRIEVGNRSGRDCTFFVGGYLRDLRVPAGGTGAMAFTVPDGAGSTVPMGCVGDTARQGTAVIEFTGLRSGPRE